MYLHHTAELRLLTELQIVSLVQICLPFERLQQRAARDFGLVAGFSVFAGISECPYSPTAARMHYTLAPEATDLKNSGKSFLPLY